MSTSGRKRRARKRIRSNPIIYATILTMTNMLEYHDYDDKPYHPGEHLRMIDVKRFDRRYYAKAWLERDFQTTIPQYLINPKRYQRYLDTWVDGEYWRFGAKLPKWLKASCIMLNLLQKAMRICSDAMESLITMSVAQQMYITGGNHNEENNTQTEEMGD